MFILRLCSRYMTTRYIALASVISILLGVATLIVVNSVMSGFRAKMRERLHGILSDVVVESRSSLDGFPEPQMVMDRIQELCGDRIAGMTPAIETHGILSYRPLGVGRFVSRYVTVVGVDPKGRCQVGDFQKHLVDPENRKDPSFALRPAAVEWRNRNLDLVDASREWPGAIVGYQIATFREEESGVDEQLILPGNEIVLTTVTSGQPKPIDGKFVVADLYKSEMSEYDERYVFVPFESLQELVMPGRANCIQIKLHSFADAPHVVETLRKSFNGAYFNVCTWEDKQGPLLHAVKVEAFLMNFILFFIIAVAGFGILSTFTMMVVEKTRDIGLLKALGASHRGVLTLFLTYGMTLGTIGAVLGAAAGIAVAWNVNPLEQFIKEQTGYEIFPRNIYYFDSIPVLLEAQTVGWVVAGALSIALFAALFPARRAARLSPVETLRYE